MTDLYVGAMSGTSLDGVDAVLVDFGSALPTAGATGRVLAHAHEPFGASLAAELLALNAPGDNELHRSALATQALAACYGRAVEAVLRQAGVPATEVRAVGAHGQTVRHRPGEFDGAGYTWQLDPGPMLSVRCGIDVVSDFRSQDVALGGQGAPLVPIYHDAMFRRPDRSVAVLNLGGMANLTGLARGVPTIGFDTGPGNVLLDLWCQRHTRQAFDAAGAWAASGRVIDALLEVLLAEPFLARKPPKSTGRDLFNAAWLEHALARWRGERSGRGAREGPLAQDIQATLAEFTARSVADAVQWLVPDQAMPTDQGPSEADDPVVQLWVCGGGALNGDLMSRLTRCLPGVTVQSTSLAGLPPMQVEACAFAWLARARVRADPSTLVSVTGARSSVSAGAWRLRPL